MFVVRTVHLKKEKECVYVCVCVCAWRAGKSGLGKRPVENSGCNFWVAPLKREGTYSTKQAWKPEADDPATEAEKLEP
jgi:hypothetical protein